MSELSRKLRALLRARSKTRAKSGVRSESMERRILFSADVPWAEPLVAITQDQDRQREPQTPPQDDAQQAMQAAVVVTADRRVVDQWQAVDADALSQLAAAGITVDVVNAGDDAIVQLSDALGQHKGVARVHVVAAADPAGPVVGDVRFDVTTVLNRASEIASWRPALTTDAQLTFHTDAAPLTGDWAEAREALVALTGANVQVVSPADPADITADPTTTDGKIGFDPNDVRRFNGSVQTVVVTNLSDTVNGDTTSIVALNASQGGDGISLREAITALNQPGNGAGPHRIEFNIAGAGPHVIALASDLPAIVNPVIIDGTSEPDYAGTPMIVLDGSGHAGTNGLVLASGSGGSTVRGLVINQFSSAAILIQDGSDGNTVAGNYIGLNAAATTAFNTARLLDVASDNNTIGGTTAADRNVIAGGLYGVLLTGASGNQITGNYFGTDASGNAALGTLFNGVSISTSSNNNIIGGPNAAEGNVFLDSSGEAVEIDTAGGNNTIVQNNAIGVGANGSTLSGTAQDSILVLSSTDGTQILDNTIAAAGRFGIHIAGTATNTIIQGNLIGTDATGTRNWGSNSAGIMIQGGASDVTLGGVGAGEGNTIANSGQTDPGAAGVELASNAQRVTIRGNSIYGNAGIGIDFEGDGQNANDVDSGTPTNTDSDSGPNGLQNYADLIAAGINGNGNFAYQIDTDTLTSGQTYTLDFYATPDPGAGSAQGQRYLGSVSGIAGSTGGLVGSMIGVSLSQGETITLLTTDSNGNTSEFSNSVTAYSTPPYDIRVAESTGGGFALNTDGGTNGYLLADDGGAILGGLTAFTAEIQFSTTNFFADSAPWDASLISYAAGASTNDLLVQVGTSGNLIFHAGGPLVQSSAMDYRLLADGQQHTLAVTWDSASGDWSVVVDGQRVDSGTGLGAGLSLGAGGVLLLGQDQDAVGGGFDARQAFSGTLHNVRLYNDVRTVEELAASQGRELDYDSAELIAQWRFDALSINNTVVEDVSGNNLSLQRASGAGFLDGTNELTLRINENAPVGTVIGSVAAQDDGRANRIAALLAADSSLVYDAQTDMFYRLSDSTADFSTSLTNASGTSLNGVSGELATARSAYENQLLVQIAGGVDVYLGGRDVTEEGVWRWLDNGADGDTFWIGDASGIAPDGAFANWGTGQPDNFGSGQDVVLLNTSGEWDDIPGLSSQFSIVAWDADEVLDATHEITYAIVAQTVGDAFVIDSSTGQISVNDPSAIDFEGPSPFQITVSATDTQGYDAERTFTIALNNVDEIGAPPVDLTSGLELNRDGGNDAYLVTTDGGDLLGGLSALTFEATVQIDSVVSEVPLISYGSSASANSFWTLVRANGELAVVFGTESITFNAINYASRIIGTGTAHSIAVTWDSQTGLVTAYVDGQVIETATAAASSLAGGPGDGTLIFGHDQDSVGGDFSVDQVFSGAIYDVRLWDHARTAQQIAQNSGQALALSGAQATDIGLLANWQMDGFNGSDEVVDVVGGINLSRGQATGAGFSTSVIVDDLSIYENAANGTLVGVVRPSVAPQLTDVVTDGRFLQAPAPGGVQAYNAGETFGGWIVTDGIVDLKDSYEVPPGGGYALDLNGPSPGAIGQTLETVPGQTYQIVIDIAGNFDAGGTSRDLRISIDDQDYDLRHERPTGWSTSNMQWETRTITFVAQSDRTTLNIASLEPGSGGAFVGNVRAFEIPTAISNILAADASLTYDALTDKFYRFVATPADGATATSNAAAAQINSVDGQLVTIRSQYENDLVQGLIDPGTTSIYLGGSDADSEGVWRWLDGGAQGDVFWNGGSGGSAPGGAYANWHPGEPDSAGGSGDEDFMTMRRADGLWVDVGDGASWGYVIEWNASEVVRQYSYAIDTQSVDGAFAIDGQTGQILIADGSLLNHESTPTQDVTVRVTDAAGNAYTETVTVTITDAAEAVVSTPAPQSLPEDGDLVFSGANAVTVSDSLAATDAIMQVTLSVNDGTLQLGGTVGITITGGADGSDRIVLHGTESALNTALDGLRFTPNTHFVGSVSLNVDAVLASQLTARYTFDDSNAFNSGIVAGNNGVIGASFATDAERGRVLSLDGDNDFVRVDGLLGEPASITLAGWMDATSVDSFGAVVVSLGTSPALYLGADGRLTGYYESGGTNYVLNSTEVLEGTGWRHVALTIDPVSGQMALFVDGVAVDTLTSTAPIEYDNFPDTYIGLAGDGAGGFDFNGQLDDVRVYSRALSAEEISVLAAEADTASSTVALDVTNTNDAPVIETINLLTNGDFEGNTLAGWTTTGTVTLTNLSLRFGVGNAEGPHTASQTFATTAGQVYVLEFQYRDDNAGLSQRLEVSLDGTETLATQTYTTSTSGTTFVTRTITFVADSASTTLTFTDVSPSSSSVDGYLDNISVTAAPTLTATTEDAAASTATTVAALLASVPGDLVTDTDPGAQEGIAITSVDGTFEYSLDGGTTWTRIGFVSTGNALLLRDTDLVRHIPNGVEGGTFGFDFRAWDQTSGVAGDYVFTGTNGGTTAFSTRIYEAGIAVAPVNDAPRFGNEPGFTVASASPGGYGQNMASLVLADASVLMTPYDSNFDTRIAYYGPDGLLDTSFGDGGYLESSAMDTSAVTGLAQLGNGQFLALGYSGSEWRIARYDADGTLDLSFGSSGIVSLALPGSFNRMQDFAIAANGDIVLVGEINDDKGVVRVDSTGALDTSFDTDGIVTLNLSGSFDQFESVEILADGRIVATGGSSLVRLNANGSLDTTFDGDGIANLAFSASDLVVQSDGAIVVTGQSGDDLFAARYNTSGALDGTFGSAGVFTLSDPRITDATASGIAQLSDGRLIIAGYAETGAWTTEWIALRLNTDGTLDTGFGDGGLWIAPQGSDYSETYSVSVYNDGGGEQIVIGGYTSQSSFAQAAVVWLNADGSVDTTVRAGLLDATPTYFTGGDAVILDGDVVPFDAELAREQSYAGATLTMSRDGGASSDDAFSATGLLGTLTEGMALLYDGITYGTVVTNSGGTLTLLFNNNTNQDALNLIAQSIAYSYAGDAGTQLVNLTWQFSDGNAGHQGPGGALAATETMIVRIESPVVAPAAIALDEDATFTFTGADAIVVSDGTAANGVVQVSLSVTQGTLMLSSLSGITILDGGDGTTFMRIEGTESDVNAALDGAVFTPFAEYSGAASLDVVVTTGGDLLGRYTFDGTGIEDRGQLPANNGALTGEATTQSDPQRGNVLSLDGDGDGVEIQGRFGDPADVTLSAWIQTTGGGEREILSLGDSIALRVDATDNLAGFIYNGASWEFLSSGATINGDWNHVALTFDSSENRLSVYINGALAGNVVTSAAIDYSLGANTFIGLHGNGSSAFDFDGLIDDARVYTRALSADEIAALAGAEVASTASVAITINDQNDAPTFAVGDGNTINALATLSDGAVDVAVLPDGRYIVLSGVNTASSGQDIDFALTRYNADGSIDTSFGSGGTVITAVNANNEAAHALAVQDDGRIVVVGSYSPGGSTDAIVLRYNANGTLDTSFDDDGMALLDLSVTGSDVLLDVAIDSSGNIVATGYGGVSGEERAYVVRLTSSGDLDTNFASGGVFEYATAGEDVRANALSVQDDGRILIAGYATRSGVTDGVVLSLAGNGTLDASFGTAGVSTLVFSGANGSVDAMTVDDQGRIVVAGTTDLSGSGDTYVWRLDADGSADTSFGSSGTGSVLVAAGSPFEGVSDIALQSDGRIVVVGDAYNGSNNDISVIRFNTDGSLDTSFDDDGMVRTALGTGTDAAQAVAIAPDGRIIVVGNTATASGGDSVILRYNPYGSLDRTFSAEDSLDATPTFVEDGAAVVLDADVAIFDAELSALDNFAGASIALVRDTGQTADDVFGASGLLSALTEGGNLIYNGVTIGTVTQNSAGRLLLTFNSAATNDRVNGALSSITYANSSDTPPASVVLNWTFDDGNVTAQGGGGARSTTQSQTVNITPVNDAPVVTPRVSSYLVSEQTPMNIHGTGFSVTDFDGGGGLLSAILSVGEGRLLIDAGDSGVTILSGNSTATVRVSGTESQLNALLGGSGTGTIVFAHDQTASSDAPSASTTFTVTVNDGGNTGTDPGLTGDGASEEGSASQTINILAINDAPVFRGPNLIVNGDFTGNTLAGWTTTGRVTSDDDSLRFGRTNAVGPHTAAQTIATQAGQTYTLEFDYRDDNGGGLNQQLQVTVDGSSNLLTTSQIVTDPDGATYVRYRFTFTADSASTTITFTDTSDNVGSFSDGSISVDGRLDNIAVYQTNGALGSVGYTEGGAPVVLEADATLFDVEIDAALDDYDGATLTLSRNGGANADDEFVATGALAFNAATLELSSVTIGTYTNTGGQLVLTFASGVSSAQVDQVIQSIAYRNISNQPPASVTLDWRFNDNNQGAQGLGGALEATGQTTVNITGVNDAPVINATNVLTNGDFATGDLTGWTTTGTVDNVGNALRFGVGDAAGPHTASQTFATAAGQIYAVTFTLRDDSAGANQSFNVSIDGASNLLDQTYSTFGTSSSTRTVYFMADSASTTLTFTDVSATSVGVDGFLDDVSVVQQPNLPSVSEDAAASTSLTVAHLLTTVAGDLVTDADAGAVEGIAITENFDTFEYSLDGGTTWARVGNLGAALNNDALLLRDSDLIRFVPNATTDYTALLTFRAWDQTSGTAGDFVDATAFGGSTALSAETATIAIDVQSVNDAPQFGNQPGYLIHNSPNLEYFQNFASLVLADGSVLMTPDDASFNSQIVYYGPDGQIDTSVGVNGVFEAPPVTMRNITELIQLADGRILAAGSNTSNDAFYVLMYNADGTLDRSYGTDGVATASFPSSTVTVSSAVLQADGRVVLAGRGDSDYALVRFNADGSLDTSFDGDGIATYDLDGALSEFVSVRVQADGRIVAAGGNELIRVNTDGSLDTTFDGDGRLSFAFNITDVLVQADGNLVVSGVDDTDVVVARVDTSGALDSSFGTGGVFTWDDPRITDAFNSSDLVQQSDGRLLLSGSAEFGTWTWEMFVLRLNTDGSLDTTFGEDGAWIEPFGTDESRAYSLALFDNGVEDQIILGGSSSQFSFGQAAVVRLNADGTLDTTLRNGQLDDNPTFFVDGDAVALDRDVVLFDAELSRDGDYGGATLTLQRDGGASADDEFVAIGLLGALTEGGSLVYDGSVVGSVVTNSGGVLSFVFAQNTPPSVVSAVAQSIGYRYVGSAAVSNVDLQWTFSDGNTGAQGSGGALSAVATSSVRIERLTTAPASGTLDEDTNFTFSGVDAITVSDGTAGNGVVQVSLTASNGTLTLSGLTGIAILSGANGSAALVIEGTESDVNAALGGMVFTPTADYHGPASVDVAVTVGGNLTGRYTFEGGSANDSSEAPANDGAFNGDATVVNDAQRGDVLSLDGAGDSVQITGLYGAPADVTLAAWVQTAAGTAQEVISLGDSVGMRIGAAGEVYGFLYNGTSFDGVTSGVTLESGWNHVALTYNVTEQLLSIYLNGSLVGSITASAPISYTLGSDTFIGNHGNGIAGFDFQGQIDDARIYTRALSAEELDVLARSEPTATDTVALTVNPINDAPVIDLDANDSIAPGTGYAATWSQGGGPIGVVDVDASIIDIDSATLASVRITLTNAVDGASEVLAADTFGTSIVASYDAVTGVLTLSGVDTLANYQQVLRTVTYDNAATLAQSNDRVIEVVADDGTNASVVATSTVSIATDQGLLVVTNLNDTVDGDTSSIDALLANQGADGISLREAILASNNSANGGGGPDIIRFDIAGAGPHIIALGSALPDITDAIIIDGSSEPDFGGTPMVVLDGGNLAGNGLTLAAGSGGSEIRGLIIRNFGRSGIEIRAGSDGNVIAGNYIGRLTDAGTDAGGATGNRDGIFISSNGNTIGAPGLGNVISGNVDAGILVVNANDNVIAANVIGLDATGASALGNQTQGVRLDGTATGNRIGGTNAGDTNVIGHNGAAGIGSQADPGTANALLGNRIFSNAGLAIDLGLDGVTANDTGDLDTGPNALMNFPVLNAANSAGGDTTILGSLQAEPSTTYRVELFATPTGDSSGHGQAATYLGFATVTTDASGHAEIATVLSGVSVAAGHAVTATATEDLGGGAYGATSELAPNQLATNTPPGVTVSQPTGGVVTSENGSSATFSVALDAPPSAAVTITLALPDAGEASLSTTTLVFTTHNWDNPQTVVVTGVDDALNDGNVVQTLVTSATVSSDPAFDGLGVDDITITTLDNDPLVDLDADDSVAAGLDYDTAWVEGAGPVALVDSDALLFAPNGAAIDGLIVTLVNPQDGAAELLGADTSGTSLSTSYDILTGTLTVSGVGTVAQYQQVLRSLTYDNASDTPGAVTRMITVAAVSGTASSPVATSFVAVTPVNDAPVLTTNALRITESGTTVLDASALQASDIDDNAAGLIFIASSITGGQFEQVTNPGVAVTTFTQAQVTAGQVQFVHDGGQSAPSYDIAVSDGRIITSPQTAGITFLPINAAPEITTSALQADENQTAIGRVTTLDADGDAVGLSIVGGSDASALSIDSAGILSFADAPNYETPGDSDQDGVYQITVRADDGNGGVTVSDVNVRVADVNEAPSVDNAVVTLDTRLAQGVIAQLTATDPDTGDQLSFSLVPGSGFDSQFSIDPQSGEIRFERVALGNGQFELPVRVTDSQGMMSEGTVRITMLGSQSQSAPTQSPDGPTPTLPGAPNPPATPSPSASTPSASGGDSASPAETADDPSASSSATDATTDADADTATDASPNLLPGMRDGAMPPAFATDALANAAATGVGDEPRALNSVAAFGIDIDRPRIAAEPLANIVLTIDRLLSEFDTGNVDDLRAVFDSLSVVVPPDLAAALDQLASADQALDQQIELRVTGAVIGTLSLSAGFVIWVLRAGSLMGSFLASRPLWTSLDPLPIFWAGDEERDDSQPRVD